MRGHPALSHRLCECSMRSLVSTAPMRHATEKSATGHARLHCPGAGSILAATIYAMRARCSPMARHTQHRRHGMAKINKVGHVVLNVSDLDTSLAFYTEALGMEVMTHNKERHMAFLSFGT